MTDHEMFLAFYAQIGIKMQALSKREADSGNICYVFGDARYIRECVKSEKFDGYSAFYSTIEFDKEGKFITQGFWE